MRSLAVATCCRRESAALPFFISLIARSKNIHLHCGQIERLPAGRGILVGIVQFAHGRREFPLRAWSISTRRPLERSPACASR